MLKSTVRALQSLLDGQRVLAVGVLAGTTPYAGLLPFVPVPDRSGVLVHASRMSKHSQGLIDGVHVGVLVHASRMSKHSQGLTDGAHVGVLVHEQDGPDKDPLQIKRATFECVVRPIVRNSAEWEAGRAVYLERFPDSRITFKLGDFTLYRLEFQSGLYVAGFGRAMEIEPRDIKRLAEPA